MLNLFYQNLCSNKISGEVKSTLKYCVGGIELEEVGEGE